MCLVSTSTRGHSNKHDIHSLSISEDTQKIDYRAHNVCGNPQMVMIEDNSGMNIAVLGQSGGLVHSQAMSQVSPFIFTKQCILQYA